MRRSAPQASFRFCALYSDARAVGSAGGHFGGNWRRRRPDLMVASIARASNRVRPIPVVARALFLRQRRARSSLIFRCRFPAIWFISTRISGLSGGRSRRIVFGSTPVARQQISACATGDQDTNPTLRDRIPPNARSTASCGCVRHWARTNGAAIPHCRQGFPSRSFKTLEFAGFILKLPQALGI